MPQGCCQLYAKTKGLEIVDNTKKCSDGEVFPLNGQTDNVVYRFNGPGAISFDRNGEIVNGSLGIIKYVSTESDFMEAGDWEYQVWVNAVSIGYSGWSQVFTFVVYDPIATPDNPIAP